MQLRVTGHGCLVLHRDRYDETNGELRLQRTDPLYHASGGGDVAEVGEASIGFGSL